MFRSVLVLAVLLVSATAFATAFDGGYTFTSRTVDGTPSMQGWNGTMTVTGTEMTRNYKSADGVATKYYVSTVTESGNVYVLKHTKAYKPEYVGSEHRSKLTQTGNTLAIESEDGKFKEVWTKK